MKEKDMIKSEELESINHEMFSPFDPEDEAWIGGFGDTTRTITDMPTFSSGQATDWMLDYEIDFSQLQEVNLT